MNDEDIDDDEDDQDAMMPDEYALVICDEIYDLAKQRKISKNLRQREIDRKVDLFCDFQRDYGNTDCRHWVGDYQKIPETIEELNYDPTSAYRDLIELLIELGIFDDEYSSVIEWALKATEDYLDSDVKILEELLKLCEVEEEDLSSGNEDKKRMAECKSRIESILFGTEPIEEKPELVTIKDTNKELNRLLKELNKLAKMN